MLIKNYSKQTKNCSLSPGKCFSMPSPLILIFLLGVLAVFNAPVFSQSNVTGGFEGRVTDGENGPGMGGISVQFINLANGYQSAKRTNADGYFQQDFLSPGVYTIKVEVNGYEAYEKKQELYATRTNRFVPLPIALKKIGVAPTTTSNDTQPNNPNPTTSPTPAKTSTTTVAGGDQDIKSDQDSGANNNPRRDGAFNTKEVSTLPLGGTTLTRTFDELAFLVLGVYLPPQAIGNSVGPGVGGGVGTSGQFSVNGLRSRANNFTVDGSDNNDEDIGVRRQGFFTLVPQPIESIQEFQIITLLAPAQYGRNLGAQVNALSKSGGNDFRGTIYGMFNTDKLNARNFFDYTGGDFSSNLTAIQNLTSGPRVVPVFVDGVAKMVFNDSGEKESMSLLQGGLAFGGPIVKNKAFFFLSLEGQLLNGEKEKQFAVPTVEQRGLDTSGATGVNQCQLIRDTSEGNGTFICDPTANRVRGYPTSVGGDAIFSLFPFPNNPNGVFGRNTYTQTLSTDAKGRIFSAKVDWNLFKIGDNQQTLTTRYNYTDDSRDLTDVGGALFSSIRPIVRTDNISTFLTGALSNNVSNEFRFSFGRTRLRFKELRDTSFLRPLSARFSNEEDTQFLLNAPLLFNLTRPNSCNTTTCFVPDHATYSYSGTTTDTSSLGPIGQLIIAGFSPVGVDVFNFPQERKNNTFQFADTIRWQVGKQTISFGTDIRRTTLDSDLPRNSRPLVTFNGAINGVGGNYISPFTNPLDLAAGDGATGFFQSLILPGNDSRIKLNYYQLDFFVQDEWRAARNFNLNFGLRYEYNTPPQEADRKIEDTFQTPRSQFPVISGIDLYRGFNDFIAGRTKIYDPDRNNFAPRIGFAWSPTSNTVIRGGYGIYYDQIIGAVVSQSRNVFPTFSTVNTGGGDIGCNGYFSFLNPITTPYALNSNCTGYIRLVQPGTLNTLNTNAASRLALLTRLLLDFPDVNGTTFGATIPRRDLSTPLSHQYSIGVEQRLFGNTYLSVAYVGTMGRKLLRFTTPNLGNNFIALINTFTLFDTDEDGNPVYNGGIPRVVGETFDPDRPNVNIGPINQFETTGRSRYDSLQIELRGRLTNQFKYQLNYVYGRVKDDVSDVFDLAGAFALPQNSITFEGEYAPANFDVRHRFTYNFIYDLPGLKGQNDFVRYLFGGWQIAGTGKFNTGQPFTVNSIFDVNFDGNLTDRLNNTQFITETGNRQQPLSLSCTAETQCQQMLAPFGQDGAIPRNSFRAGSILDLDLSFSKRFTIRENNNLQFRVDVFNFINRANFGIPVRFLGAPGFGQATDTVTPGRRIQFALKYNF